MQSGGAIPPLQRGISAILARYPMKTRQMGAIPPSAILSRKGIARYGGVSRTGPLSKGAKTMPLADHAFARVTPAIFVIFIVFMGSEQQSPCFILVRTKIRHFRRFRQTPVSLAGDKGTVYQWHRVCDPDMCVCLFMCPPLKIQRHQETTQNIRSFSETTKAPTDYLLHIRFSCFSCPPPQACLSSTSPLASQAENPPAKIHLK